MMRRLALTLVAAVMGLASAGVAAMPARGTANIGEFAIELYDLDPTDGVTPEVRFSPYGIAGQFDGVVFSGAGVNISNDSEFAGDGAGVAEQFKSHAARAEISGGWGQSAITGDGSFEQLALSSAGSLSGGTYVTSASAYTYFTITPNTLVSISASANVWLDARSGMGTAFATLSIGRLFPSDIRQGSEELLRFDLNGDQQSESASFLTTVTNLDNTEGLGYFGAESYVSAMAIPEPGTWALMALGFAAVTWTARKRRAAASRGSRKVGCFDGSESAE